MPEYIEAHYSGNGASGSAGPGQELECEISELREKSPGAEDEQTGLPDSARKGPAEPGR